MIKQVTRVGLIACLLSVAWAFAPTNSSFGAPTPQHLATTPTFGAEEIQRTWNAWALQPEVLQRIAELSKESRQAFDALGLTDFRDRVALVLARAAVERGVHTELAMRPERIGALGGMLGREIDGELAPYLSALLDLGTPSEDPERDKLIQAWQELLPFRAAGGLPSVGMVIGGTNVRAGAMTETAVVRVKSRAWRDVQINERTVAHERAKIQRDFMLEDLREELKHLLGDLSLSAADIGKIGVSWAAPGRYEEGLVYMTPKTPAFMPEHMGYYVVSDPYIVRHTDGQVYFDLRRWLQETIRMVFPGAPKVEVEILHDGAAAISGELPYQVRTGALKAEYLDGHAVYGGVVWPGSENERVIQFGIGEVGLTTYAAEMRGTQTTEAMRLDPQVYFEGSKPQEGEASLEHWVGGVAVARRFVQAVEDSVNGNEAAVQTFFGTDLSLAELYKGCSKNGDERDDEVSDMVLKKWGQELKTQGENSIAWTLMEAVAEDEGRALALLLHAYPKGYALGLINGTGIGCGFYKLDNAELPTVITLVGGFHEKAATNLIEGTDDPFMGLLWAAAGKWLREFGATEAEQQNLPGRIIRSTNNPGLRDLQAFLAERPPVLIEADIPPATESIRIEVRVQRDLDSSI